MKAQPKTIQRIGFAANTHKTVRKDLLRHAARLILKSGREVVFDASTRELAGLKGAVVPSTRELAASVDVLLVFGGDGTMLRVARDVAGLKTPILGIKAGGLGFLTAVQSDGLLRAFNQIWEGNYTLDRRPLIEAHVETRPGLGPLLAMNDFVLGRGDASRLVELSVSVDEEFLTEYRCDGLIISSPTGSTAYSLAAGGAIVSPKAQVLSLTPICPHTLSNRAVIVNSKSVVRVRVLSGHVPTILTADGQVPLPLNPGDKVHLSQSSRSVQFLRLAGGSFFGTLRRKLGWTGSNV